MPLPILPASNTPRFRVFYTVVARQHSMQIRSHQSPAAVGDLVNDFFTAIGASGFVKSIDFVDFAPSGSDIFNPVVTGIEGNLYGSLASAPLETAAWAFTFIGRTSGGRRVRLAVFGATSLGTNYRFTPGESGQLDSARAVLVAAGSNLRGIDDVAPVWKTYVNSKPNDHWVEQLRP